MPVVAVPRAPFRTGENGEVAGGVRGHGHDAAGFHVSGFFPGKEHIAAYLIAEGGVVHGRIHGRETGRRQPLPDFGKGRAAFFFGLHPFGDGKDDAFVPVFPQDGPCVDVIVQVPVVKGDQQGARRQRCALQQKGLRFIKADPAPAVFGHASALVFKMFRADGDSPRKSADVMVHEYRKAVCAHGASLNCLEGIRGNGLVCGGDGPCPLFFPAGEGMGKTPYTVRYASEHRACRFFMMKRARFQPCSDTEKGAAPSSEPPPEGWIKGCRCVCAVWFLCLMPTGVRA